MKNTKALVTSTVITFAITAAEWLDSDENPHAYIDASPTSVDVDYSAEDAAAELTNEAARLHWGIVFESDEDRVGISANVEVEGESNEETEDRVRNLLSEGPDVLTVTLEVEAE